MNGTRMLCGLVGSPQAAPVIAALNAQKPLGNYNSNSKNKTINIKAFVSFRSSCNGRYDHVRYGCHGLATIF